MNNFSAARDLIYLASVFIGIGCGVIITALIKYKTSHLKGSLITISIFAFSAAVASFSFALLYSKGSLSFNTNLLIVSVIIVIVFCFSVLFPLRVFFPLVILTSVVVILYAFFILRLPLLKNDGITIVSFYVSSDNGIIFETADSNKIETVQTYFKKNETYYINYTVAVITAPLFMPLAGGQKRCLPLSLNLSGNDKRAFSVYHPKEPINSLLSNDLAGNMFNSFRMYRGELPVRGTIGGIKYKIVFNGSELELKK
ncbi:hypothetical protein AGMMS50212_11380 [Spirochaetia bacterium]|nr:hypothetical protein AGMMS50212_11380 [Spirochaetia bacterium]